MHVGVPAEVKNREARVALTPAGAMELVAAGHEVTIQAGAGAGAGMPDEDYVAAGARIGTVDDAWGADLVLKVKEPVPSEYARLRGDLTLFTFLHLAANEPLAAALVASGTTALSYDTVQLADGSLPLLTPMSAVAGTLSVLAGAYHLLGPLGGSGVLLAGVPGVAPGYVTVVGAGVAGSHAVRQAVAMGAYVTVLDISRARLDAIATEHGPRVRTELSTEVSVAAAVAASDLVIGAVLVPGKRAPRVVTRAMVERMRPGSVVVDIAIDQGGCCEDSRPTTHDAPTFSVAGVTFYCVANMPGAVASTSARALTNATLPYALALANFGWEAACTADAALAAGVNVAGGTLRHPAVVAAHPHLPAATRAT